MSVSVIIPTLNAEKYIGELLESLLCQSIPAEIIVVDSSSDDDTVSVVKRISPDVKLISVERKSFDHGGTRDLALRQSSGDLVVFLTQDALPVNDRCIEMLLSAFEDPSVAAVYARQTAREDAPEYEKLIREYNYPSNGHVRCEKDIAKYGVKSYFFSDTCAAYRRSAYELAGGFDSPIESNEDMMIAAKFLHSGYSIAYEPRASVYHSHSSTLRQDLRRNIVIGRVMEKYKDRLYGSDTLGEGSRLFKYVAGSLIKKKMFIEFCAFVLHTGVRFIGNRFGKAQIMLGGPHENDSSSVKL